MLRNTEFRLTLASLALFALSACADSTLKIAVDLGKAGQTAASNANQAAVVSADQFATYRDGEVFDHAYVYGPPQDAAATSKEDANQKELNARADLFTSLSKAYASLGDLAGSDASTTAEARIKTLFDTVGSYAAVVKPVSAIVAPVAGEIVKAVQAQKAIVAADQIKVQLNNIIGIMENHSISIRYLSDKKSIIKEMAGNATILLDRGLLSAKPAAEAMGKPFGLAPVDNFDAKLRTDPRARAGMNAVITSHLVQSVERVGTAYDDSLKALKALLPEHDKLDAGVPLDLTQLEQALQKLDTTVTAIASANKGTTK